MKEKGKKSQLNSQWIWNHFYIFIEKKLKETKDTKQNKTIQYNESINLCSSLTTSPFRVSQHKTPLPISSSNPTKERKKEFKSFFKHISKLERNQNPLLKFIKIEIRHRPILAVHVSLTSSIHTSLSGVLPYRDTSRESPC